jgi:hypothetical protein
MLGSANRDPAATLRLFANHGVDCSLLVPTATGLGKSILDATDSVRAWLREQRVHDYASQGQGPDAKVSVETVLFSRGEVVATTTSLYRPVTKEGDPRIWFGGLARHAEPTDLLAICAAGTKLLVVNTSQSDLPALLADARSSFWSEWQSAHPSPAAVPPMSTAEALDILGRASSPAASPAVVPEGATAVDQGARLAAGLPAEAVELLAKLRLVGERGYVPTQRPGDTGVGYTLETLLGIKCNSSKAPDYKGIEIKAGRRGSHLKNRTTILSQVPDWKISRLKGSGEILRERGRFNAAKNRVQLFHEVCASKPNSYGLFLELGSEPVLHQSWTDGANKVRDATWKFETLFSRLAQKHGQTFWVKADSRGRGDGEEFHYAAARYTSGVSEAKLPMLLEAGVITLDYTIKETSTGGAKDQGYLFKIRQADLPLLFKSPVTFELA